jgi:hypothetical protein
MSTITSNDKKVVLDRNTIKTELENYKKNNGLQNSKSDRQVLDRQFLTDLENKYGVRLIGLHAKGDNLNLQVYVPINGHGYSTATIPIENFRDSKYTLRFAGTICTVLSERVKLDPKNISDKTTADAVKAMPSSHEIYSSISPITKALKNYL